MQKSVLLFFAATVLAPAQNFKTLVHFDGTNGARPMGALVQGLDGNLYSTTAGTPLGKKFSGSVFTVTSMGALTTLQSLSGFPAAGLLQATDGSFYGTSSGKPSGTPAVFKIAPDGALTTLYTFCAHLPCPDGSIPQASLIQASDGNFYGTTSDYGAHRRGGTIFKITPDGTLTTLYSFCAQANCADGANPHAALLQAKDGNLYGTTPFGGNPSCDAGCGTIFKIDPSGTLTTVYTFCSLENCADSASPIGGLVEGTDGSLYGTTFGDGFDDDGSVFKVTPEGTLTTLYSFCAQPNCADGAAPQAGLIQATDGNFYGTTWAGANGFGTIFQITPAGTLTTLHSFCAKPDCFDGGAPLAPLVQGTEGKFYGTTYGDLAPKSLGTVFSLSMGLRPFITALPASGSVGTPVTILGTNLTGATSVTFTGADAASFSVNATGSAISTTVPSGAKSGKIRVTTPHGVRKSNVPFRVKP